MATSMQELLEYFQKVPQPFAEQFADLLAQFLNKLFELRVAKLKQQQAAGNPSETASATGESKKTFRRPPFLRDDLAVERNAQLADFTKNDKPQSRPGR